MTTAALAEAIAGLQLTPALAQSVPAAPFACPDVGTVSGPAFEPGAGPAPAAAASSRIATGTATPVGTSAATGTADWVGSDQLYDLIEAMGADLVVQLVDRFESELPDLRASLTAPLAAAAAPVQDGVLHSFKGAALTLGMAGAGERAHSLRSRLPIGPDEVEMLIAQAQDDIRQARRSLMEWSE